MSKLDEFKKQSRRIALSKAKKKELYENKQWYTIRSLLGNSKWCNWYICIGARQRGKTFAVQDYVLGCFFNPKNKLYHVPFYWMRLNDIAIKNMLMNNGAKMFEPILVRKYHLENIKVKGDSIFIGDLLLCRVYGLSTAYNNKGAALFDEDNWKGVNIICDECALEKNQKHTMDPAYNLQMNVENICRHHRDNVKIFLLLNNTEEAPEMVVAITKFLPVEFGVYKLKRKNAIIDYIPNTEAYNKLRKTALANQVDTGTGNFTNKLVKDLTQIYKKRLSRPNLVVKFSKDQGDWFSIWDGNIICPYHGEQKESVAMRRYIDDKFLPELRDSIIEQEDVRAFKYRDLLTQTLWRKNLELIKK